MNFQVGGAASGPTTQGDVSVPVLGTAADDDWTCEALSSRFSALVSSIIVSHRLNDEDAARVSATVWRRLESNLGGIRRPDRIATWLGAVARDECVKALTSPTRRAA